MSNERLVARLGDMLGKSLSKMLGLGFSERQIRLEESFVKRVDNMLDERFGVRLSEILHEQLDES